jgi:hypothetical protein
VSLQYEHVEDEASDTESGNDLTSVVMRLLAEYKREGATTSDELPELFTSLVHAMRRLKFHEIYDVFAKIESDDEVRRLALDAVPLLRTDDGIRFMVDRLLSEDGVDAAAADKWFGVLAFYKNPSKFMISSMTVSFSSSENLTKFAKT